MHDENTDQLTAFLDSSVALKMLSNDILSRHTLPLCPVNKRAAISISVYKQLLSDMRGMMKPVQNIFVHM
ncbi:hypothetical protein T03_5465 [Trichinella britovi]|uniref:Uncharacterized protein n=1 Tax=Trichinella britovi TaxID=45882 RepID=A0A0V1AMC5_TRIBR|nr:hypothetical protein T03_5465 [Trichinella britovi]